MSVDRYSGDGREGHRAGGEQPPQSFGHPEIKNDSVPPDYDTGLPVIECPERLRAIVDNAHGVRVVTSLPTELAANRKNTYFPNAEFKHDGWQRKLAPKLRALAICEVMAFMPATEVTTKTWQALKEEPMKGVLGRLGLKTYVDFSEVNKVESPFTIQEEEGMHVDYMFVPEYSRDPNLVYDYPDEIGRGGRTLHIQTFLPRSSAEALWIAVRDDRNAARMFAEQLFLKSDIPRKLWDDTRHPVRPPYENLGSDHKIGVARPIVHDGIVHYEVESVDF